MANGGPDADVRGGSEADLLQGGGGSTSSSPRPAATRCTTTTRPAPSTPTSWTAGPALATSCATTTAPAAVTVDLSTPGAAAGEAGENDSLAGFEGAYTGAGIDRLTAGRAAVRAHAPLAFRVVIRDGSARKATNILRFALVI